MKPVKQVFTSEDILCLKGTVPAGGRVALLDGLLVLLVGVQDLEELLVDLRLAGEPVLDLVDVVDGVVELDRLRVAAVAVRRRRRRRRAVVEVQRGADESVPATRGTGGRGGGGAENREGHRRRDL